MANHALTPCGDIALLLTEAEAKGLLAFADEGASGLLPDASARLAYVGRPAAVAAANRALAALSHAAAGARQGKHRGRKST